MKGNSVDVATVSGSPSANLTLIMHSGYKTTGPLPARIIMCLYRRKPSLSSKSGYFDQQTKMAKLIKLS